MPKRDLMGAPHQRFCLLLFVCILLTLFAGKIVAADENNRESSVSTSVKRKSSHPYCGLYCLYTAMKLADREVDFRELLKPEYISSRKGSSLAELKKAAEDNGLYAVAAGKLTSRELRASSYPIILHVKSAADKKEYDHFELFLGTENGQAKLFDPPEPVKLAPFYELAPRWDGTGLIVSAEPIKLGVIFGSARKRFIICSAVAVAFILIIRWCRKKWLLSETVVSRYRLFGYSIAQSFGLVVIALLGGMVYHFANDEGFLAHANATAPIEQAHLANFIPKIKAGQISQLLNTDTVFIDARYSDDFKEGHIEGAINVPASLCDKGRHAVLANIDKSTNIVVYCQSAGCRFAEKVAVKLAADGFSSVSIFKGGWNEWKVKNDD
ncbi:MAG: hypothetical protein DRH24_19840 [Deltaproteobacteria bacterium]|nr:MAG: hypothetical protein DRH24_19840 [Deltaproteobacteria bacterium]